LVDLCGLQVEQELDGHSLKPLLMNPETAWDQPVLMSHGPGNFAVRLGGWRLIHYADGSEELYDMEADPGELTNLATHTKHDDTRRKLRGHLPKSWRYVLGRRFKEFSDSFAKPTPQTSTPPGKP
jgi:arylsulfatase A-like enzyme